MENVSRETLKKEVIMSIYNWIMKVLFNTYEEWRMKNPTYNRNGFHIVGIDNSLKAMHDGYFMYTEIYPPYAIRGCTLMKAIAGKSEELVDLYMEINGKKYCISDLSYNDATQIMRKFVQKQILPEEKYYVEVLEDDSEKVKNTFAELSELLLGDSKNAMRFLNRVKPEKIEDVETAWYELYEELLIRKKVIELDWKEQKDDLIYAVKKLSAGLNLEINEEILDSDEDIPRWGKVINSLWTEYVLAAMDVGSDSYVLMILSKDDFVRAKKLAKEILQRIAVIEEM